MRVSSKELRQAVAEQIEAAAEVGWTETEVGSKEQIEAAAEQIVATSSRSRPRRSPAKPGEPILVRDDHRRSLVIEVGTGEAW